MSDSDLHLDAGNGGAVDEDADGGDAVDEIVAAWRRERPDLPVESIGIITRVWRIGRLLEQRRATTLRAVGIDASTLDLLSTLRRAGAPYELPAGELAARSLITTGAVTQRLDRAEAAGHVVRRRAAGDARVVLVSMTAAGRRILDTAVADILGTEEALLAGLDPAIRDRLIADLRSLLRHVSSQ